LIFINELYLQKTTTLALIPRFCGVLARFTELGVFS
jgi:hypothetical protein